MASRLRNGMRLPSVTTLRKIVNEFDLDLEEAVEAHGKGSAEFGQFLRRTVFDRTPEPVLDS
jgi:transcriptional regulator with XRE-family HTH domain